MMTGSLGKALISLGLVVFISGCQNLKPLPEGLSYSGEMRPAQSVEFLVDSSWVDANGQRQLEQEIFDTALRYIAESRELILVDMFLFNDFMGKDSDPFRPLSSELAHALIKQKQAYPDMQIVLITDPVNTVYGGYPSALFDQMRESGISVVMTDLDKLHDSNQVYSFIWRLFIRPFGNSTASTLPNPFGRGRVSLRSYLRLLNFKANHRKVLIADSAGSLRAMVTSANPHDGSSAHRNVALGFEGLAAQDLLQSENAVLRLSGQPSVEFSPDNERPANENSQGIQIGVVSESGIKSAVLALLQQAGRGESVDLLMFYLSDRELVEALIAAHQRGANVRVMLDPNKDAFGREKNGIPNRPVAAELHEAGVAVRWCRTAGEQCHGKMIVLQEDDQTAWLSLGSANYTRRNLDDFNLESNILLSADSRSPVVVDALDHFQSMWENRDGRGYSVGYDEFSDESLIKRWVYRAQEWSGLSTF